ncbi:MAG TPA: sigma 54-interacting transcriptional regulator [Candidatus Paceibacterota bacterium]|jgi:energy-coupling factor transporter ATP-binding protein EcfA2
MGEVRLGPKATLQLAQISRDWKQGQHVLITGGTGSGKTRLARELDEIRVKRGGHVVVFVCKLRPDETIKEAYSGFTRWTRWQKPKMTDTRILLWPAVEGLPQREAVKLMWDTFAHALSEISRVGRWTVHIDEGLFFTSPRYLNFGKELGMMYQLMRTSKATMITLAQRPAHLPLEIYANVDYAFIGRANEVMDMKRLANLDGNLSSKQLAALINSNGKHDFTYVPIALGKPPERINLAE